MRRGVNMVYIVENNGVYGLTKGQFSATADKGSKSKRGVVNSDEPIDMVMLALQLGATFVARSFSGDKTQLVPLIKAAIQHQGAAFIDVISPCVAFNNHAGSTKSYDYVREHNEAVNRLDFIAAACEITADYAPGTVRGSARSTTARCCACASSHADYDPTDRIAAMNYLQRAPRRRRGRDRPALPATRTPADLHAALNTVDSASESSSAKRSWFPAPPRSTVSTPRCASEARGRRRRLRRAGRATIRPCGSFWRIALRHRRVAGAAAGGRRDRRPHHRLQEPDRTDPGSASRTRPGRELRVGGSVDLKLSLEPKVVIEDVSLAMRRGARRRR